MFQRPCRTALALPLLGAWLLTYSTDIELRPGRRLLAGVAAFGALTVALTMRGDFVLAYAYQHTTSWLVVGDASSEFAQWACRFLVLLGSPLQDFRVHYVPNDYYFLTDRSTGPEHRALLASFAGLSFGPGDDTLLGDGWSGAERDGDHFARWAIGRQAFIAIPAARDGDGAISFDISPPGSQSLTVNLNNAQIARVVLDPQPKRYAFHGTFRTGITCRRSPSRSLIPAA